ncbi:NPR1/NH1-interacting protein [Dillenia turbinata]|uniref:NPR1/NH1-interacting protein n=1 Tax=Dillenia turbinata TaxID=194707 RepID=A0AAN8YUK1_9MAGN
MDGERKKRKVDREDNEEEKMEKFFALIRSTKEVRDHLLGEGSELKEKEKEKEEKKEAAEGEKQRAVWNPTFQPEDFMENPPQHQTGGPSEQEETPADQPGTSKQNEAKEDDAGPPPNGTGRKDRDEDLLLFHELHKPDEERVISLLQPVSDEFEPGGNYSLYKIPSGKKGSGYEFLAGSDKNDSTGRELVKNATCNTSISISRNGCQCFRPSGSTRATNCPTPFKDASKASNRRPKSPNPKVPRSATASDRPRISSAGPKNTKVISVLNTKMTQLITTLNKSALGTSHEEQKNKKDSHMNVIASNLSKTTVKDSKTKPRSCGVSPFMRSTIAAQIRGFTNRSTSATRGYPGNPVLVAQPKPEPITKPRRQSCSPSVTRGRQLESKQENEGNSVTQREKIQAGNGKLVFGSQMVEKVMNARKTGGEERGMKPIQGSVNESGFAKTMCRSPHDVAPKHTEMKRDSVHVRHHGATTGLGKISRAASSTTSSRSTSKAV